MNNIKSLASMNSGSDFAGTKSMPGTGVRMAMAVIGILPIMVLYPFFQKAFIAGIALGGVKE
jgi:putative aldouronate transport system permease protein